jgi:hypothetical protein
MQLPRSNAHQPVHQDNMGKPPPLVVVDAPTGLLPGKLTSPGPGAVCLAQAARHAPHMPSHATSIFACQRIATREHVVKAGPADGTQAILCEDL